MYNNGNTSKNVTGSSVVDGTLENADYADNAISGDKIDGGTISNFTSTGIDDNATSTAITISSAEQVTFVNDLQLTNVDHRVVTGTTTGRAIISNSATTAYMSLYGDTHASTPNRIDLAAPGDVRLLSGNLVMGTSGKGIDFSATSDGSGTMTSEVLDDYEEGTWTPSLGGTAVYDETPSGTYTKIGNTVFIKGNIRVLTIGTGNTQTITGLPFTAAAGTGGSIGVYYHASLATASIFIIGQVPVSTATMQFNTKAASGATMTYKAVIFQNLTDIYFSGSYDV